ncbi:hypothetical protein [Streptomyces sp. Ag109_O5-1]|uniref:hypothetical protein n=1 Tax=Streptomyces sp. Ag109_O5-1 TaxID=1938851 RepID=UPI000F4FCA31|nr:hypothetical protein [Streptomyces sp. Ag109_O5-1]
MHIRGGIQVLVAGLLMAATVACDAGVHYSVPDTRAGHETSARPSGAATPTSAARHPAGTTAAEPPASSLSAIPSGTRSRTATSAPGPPDCTARDLVASEGYGVGIRVPGDSRPPALAPAKTIAPCDQEVEVTPFDVTA